MERSKERREKRKEERRDGKRKLNLTARFTQVQFFYY